MEGNRPRIKSRMREWTARNSFIRGCNSWMDVLPDKNSEVSQTSEFCITSLLTDN